MDFERFVEKAKEDLSGDAAEKIIKISWGALRGHPFFIFKFMVFYVVMRILAVETSCDETAIAIAEFSGLKANPRIKVLSNIVSSQVKLHAKFGGVVPNLAKREHQRNLVPILLRALREAEIFETRSAKREARKKTVKSRDSYFVIRDTILEREPELFARFKKRILPLKPPPIDAIAVTHGPGLAPALWVGVNFVKALSYIWDKSLIPVNHMEGHIYSALANVPTNKRSLVSWNIREIRFPALALLVSGGHTELVLMRGHGKYKIVGETRDDAAGEAFDKVARILELKYPGGPEISRLAEKGDPKKYPLPSPMINTKDYDFSFSGLKTAVLYLTRDLSSYELRSHKMDIAASFQKAVVDVLVKKTIRAAKEYKVKTVLFGGGVAANRLLRERLGQEVKEQLPNSSFLIPDFSLTGDNALMIALAAYFYGKKKAWSKVQAKANVRLGEMWYNNAYV